MGYGHQCRRINDCGVGYYETDCILNDVVINAEESMLLCETDCILNDVVSDGSVWGNGPALQRLGPVIAVAMVKPAELSEVE